MAGRYARRYRVGRLGSVGSYGVGRARGVSAVSAMGRATNRIFTKAATRMHFRRTNFIVLYDITFEFVSSSVERLDRGEACQADGQPTGLIRLLWDRGVD